MSNLSSNRGQHGSPSRLFLIDAFKAVGSQLIVLHHLAFYGPMSDWTHQMWPELVSWFSQNARMAVQVFLVVAGFLAARSLAPDGVLADGRLWRQIGQRYQRVVLPFAAALLVAMVCAAWARAWMIHESLPAPPELGQFVAHVLLLHSVLDVDSLSAGVWYVAIDFQLYVMLLAVLWLVRRGPLRRCVAAGLVTLLVALSLLHFNLDAGWDVWGVYFFGAYGLGVLTYWATRGESPAFGRFVAWLAVLALVLLALAVDFRERIALALGVAVVLGAAQRGQWLQRWPNNRAVVYLSQISYSVFLLNFPVALVVNALGSRFLPADPWWQTGGVLLAWLVCNLAAAVFHHWVEVPLGRVGRARRAPVARSGVTAGHVFHVR